ncbi:MAG: hypothetical protein ACREUE_04950 [Panacagrimonas sp.]
MFARLRAAAPTITAVLCFIVLAVRISGVHAHRDLGIGPESAIHERGHHEHAHHHDDHLAVADAHGDGEVDVEVDAATGGTDLLNKLGVALVAVLMILGPSLLLHRGAVPRPRDRGGPTRRSRIHWRPPLRGPPALSIV